MTLRVEMIVIGDEILNGTVTDTNGAWVGRQAAALGAVISRRQVVPDIIADIVDAMRLSARSSADLVVLSGGLGPTQDDLTAQAAAAFLGVDVVLHREALDQVQARRLRSGRAVGALDEKQAWLPAGATVLENPVGTAPAFCIAFEGTTFIALPGVPRELHELMRLYVLPRIAAGLESAPAVDTWKFFGVTESELATQVNTLDTAGLELHYRAHFPEIHVTAVAPDPARVARFGSALTALLGHRYFGGADAEFPAVINAALAARGFTVATAESCTGGLVGQMITSVPGSSAVYEYGVIAYANSVKRDVLGVPQALLDEHGAVSQPVVEAMAAGVRERAKATFGIAVSGIAGPGGGTADKPVGTVHIAVADPEGVQHRRLSFPFERERTRVLAAYAALSLIHKDLHRRGLHGKEE